MKTTLFSRSFNRLATWRIASAAVALLFGAGLALAEVVALIDAEQPAAGWSFDNGREFPGAKGGLVVDAAVEAQRRPALRLDGDFTGGGNYVQAGRNLPGGDVDSLAFWLKAPEGLEQLTLRLVDGSGQCHQFNLRTEPHGRWQRIRFPVAAYFAKAGTSAAVELVKRYEGWGGAKDGKWHDPAKALYILAGRTAFGEARQGSIWISQVEVGTPEAGGSYAESFDAAETLPAGWRATGPAGAVAVVADAPFEGARALRLQRAETQLGEAVAVAGVAFAAAPGPWRLAGATRGRLHSPDNSFVVRLDVKALDGAGAVLEGTTLVDETGGGQWKAFSRQVKFPRGTAAARFAAAFFKTHGSCDVDALTAAPLQAEAEADIVERIVIGSAAVGNLFLPEEEVAFDLEVRTERPLPAGGRAAEVAVRDYWGAEQADALRVALEGGDVVDERHRYTGRVALPKDALAVGKYYELHVAVKPEGFAAAAEYSGFARLPVAESRQHPAEKIPFTIRNWDSRIPEYHKIASRIGHRQIGTWGDSGWERIRDLGAQWYGGPSGVSQIEREGWKNITEDKLRQNAIDFMTRHKDTESLACIMLGNEPNERHELIEEKIRAYRVAYEALKSVKPDVKVVTTSVPPLESFFEAGYHRYTDVYDFHVYETYENVRQAIRRYRELGRKYGAEKPIWCTELGLNSQGQTRHAVAQELVKKITAFFAEGGDNVSWFTILYPDADGKARGTSGDAHNTFDCQYNRYNPRLDAIMYYNMINGVAVKRFVDEVRYANGVQSYLFRDDAGDCLHVLWKEGDRVDCGIPLPGVEEARLIRIDGSDVAMKPADGVVTLGLSGEPVLLRYRQTAPAPLSRELAAPAFAAPEPAPSILKGGRCAIVLRGAGLKAADLEAALPPRWTAAFSQAGDGDVLCTIAAPADTAARTGRVMLRRVDDSAEIILPLAIMSPVSVDLVAGSRNAAGEPAVRVVLANHAAEASAVDWTVEVVESFPVAGGSYKLAAPVAPEAYLKGDVEGHATLAPGAAREVVVTLAGGDATTLYRIRAEIADALGRKVVRERLVGGFATAARTDVPVEIDGVFDETAWAAADVQTIDLAEQNFRFGKAAPWRGADDLSATWRALWDDANLYLAVAVADDVHVASFTDASIWNQDGLQFLFDPARTAAEKSGKYDYSLGVGPKGPQAWCHLSAHGGVREGEAKAFKIAAAPLPGSAGGRRYEVAIPWAQLAPFQPESGANLGMTMILNEDDGAGRVGFMGWFSGAHSKELDLVGDLVLGDEPAASRRGR